MKLPQLSEPSKYIGLYIVDFGDHSAVGFTAEEVAELLESEQFADAKVYRIYRAAPDGTMELKGVSRSTFQKESGMFFYADDEPTAHADYQRLVNWAAKQLPPARCKLHLTQSDDTFVTALMYPAEYEDAFSSWLLDGQYKTPGLVQAGPSAVTQYNQCPGQIIAQTQLWPQTSIQSLHGSNLHDAARRALVR